MCDHLENTANHLEKYSKSSYERQMKDKVQDLLNVYSCSFK